MEIPDNILSEIREIIERGDYEYADNYRAARLGNEVEMVEFDRIKDHGCCGSHDEEITVDGVKWIVGFNYGH